ncbi:PREDICTED: E3 ubiquitin-protein ligase At4g11680-like isoform X2 [Brassica oleracea var. oleracea]|uniref:E3 ubiquitin-protein ligase At4g11680-like isoform X2 n=1 Tax=Brassica oleracea var. oleracea TaxID=109376 RepID=UPI0006A7496E|nr:PREDICTED: E3 ubiquitin-protein ligase At4g11680-like isoform X2 [Brassica oleracea var. oleracea]
MREPSMLVRESAVEQLEERQNDWADSNDEKSNTPLRVLIIGYGLQCVMHMFCVCVEYRKRSNRIQISPYSMEDQYLESGSQRYNVLIYMVDHLILLGIFWWPRANTRITSPLMVLYSVSWYQCVLCGFLCCTGLCGRHCGLLLLPLHHCSSIRSGKTSSFELLRKERQKVFQETQKSNPDLRKNDFDFTEKQVEVMKSKLSGVRKVMRRR